MRKRDQILPALRSLPAAARHLANPQTGRSAAHASIKTYPAVSCSRDPLGELLSKNVRPGRLPLCSRRGGRGSCCRLCLRLLRALRCRLLRRLAQLLRLAFGGTDLQGHGSRSRRSVGRRLQARTCWLQCRPRQGRSSCPCRIALPLGPRAAPCTPCTLRQPGPCLRALAALTRCCSWREAARGAAAGSRPPRARNSASPPFSSSPPSLECWYLTARGARFSRGSSGQEVSRSCSSHSEAGGTACRGVKTLGRQQPCTRACKKAAHRRRRHVPNSPPHRHPLGSSALQATQRAQRAWAAQVPARPCARPHLHSARALLWGAQHLAGHGPDRFILLPCALVLLPCAGKHQAAGPGRGRQAAGPSVYGAEAGLGSPTEPPALPADMSHSSPLQQPHAGPQQGRKGAPASARTWPAAACRQVRRHRRPQTASVAAAPLHWQAACKKKAEQARKMFWSELSAGGGGRPARREVQPAAQANGSASMPALGHSFGFPPPRTAPSPSPCRSAPIPSPCPTRQPLLCDPGMLAYQRYACSHMASTQGVHTTAHVLLPCALHPPGDAGSTALLQLQHDPGLARQLLAQLQPARHVLGAAAAPHQTQQLGGHGDALQRRRRHGGQGKEERAHVWWVSRGAGCTQLRWLCSQGPAGPRAQSLSSPAVLSPFATQDFDE